MTAILAKDIKNAWNVFFTTHPDQLHNEELLARSKIRVRRQVLSLMYEESFPTLVLEELSKLEDYELLSKMVLQRNCTPELLTKIFHTFNTPTSNYVSLTVQVTNRNIANNHNTPSYILEQLSASTDLDILIGVALNPNTPVYVLQQLYVTSKENSLLCNNVLTNPLIPEICLETSFRRSKHNSSERVALALNPALSRVLTEKLLGEKSSDLVRAVARYTVHYDLLEPLIDSNIRGVKVTVISRLFEQNFFGDWPQDWVEAHYGVKLTGLSELE